MTCPLIGSEVGVDLILIQTLLLLLWKSSCSYLFIYLFMLTSWHLHDKSWDTSSLACTHGQLTKHTTVKWPISAIMQHNHMNSFSPVSIWFEAGWELLSTKPNCKQFFRIKQKTTSGKLLSPIEHHLKPLFQWRRATAFTLSSLGNNNL